MAGKNTTDILQVQNIVQDFDIPFDEEWALQYLKNSWMLRQSVVKSGELAKYRSVDLGIWDAEDLKKTKEFFDPRNEDAKEGGESAMKWLSLWY